MTFDRLQGAHCEIGATSTEYALLAALLAAVIAAAVGLLGQEVLSLFQELDGAF